MSRGVRLIAVLAAALLAIPATALADPTDEIEQSRAAEATTATRIAELERELAQLTAAREEAAIRAGQANEAYLEASVHLEEARIETREARRAAQAAADDVEAARESLGAIAQLLYQGGSASLATLMPFLTTENFEVALDSAMYMEQLATRTEDELQRFEALQTVAAILMERAERADAAEQAAVDELAVAAEVAQQEAEAAEFQLAYSAEQRDALIASLAEQRATTVELERARQDTLEAERIERENLAAIREAQTVAAVDSLAAAPVAATEPVPVAAEPVVEPERDTSVSRDNEREETVPSPAPSPSPTTARPTVSPTPSPTTIRPTTPAPTPAPSPSATTARPTPSPTPSPTTTTPAPTPTPTPTPTPAPPPPAPAPAPSVLPAATVALNFALSQVGKPYIWGATGPDGYDCSGLTQTSYRQAGIYLPRTTRDQYYATARVPLADMRPGDLIFYSSNGAPSGIYHVAIYAGGGMRVHAPSPGKFVEHVKMYYGNIMPYAGRVTG